MVLDGVVPLVKYHCFKSAAVARTFIKSDARRDSRVVSLEGMPKGVSS